MQRFVERKQIATTVFVEHPDQTNFAVGGYGFDQSDHKKPVVPDVVGLTLVVRDIRRLDGVKPLGVGVPDVQIQSLHTHAVPILDAPFDAFRSDYCAAHARRIRAIGPGIRER